MSTTPLPPDPGILASSRLLLLSLALAGLALLLGAAVYALDRRVPAVWLWPAIWPLGSAELGSSWFGAAGGWLPSWAHAYAFSLLSLACLHRRRRRARFAAAWVCGAWWLVDSAFELAQHPRWSARIAAALPDWFAQVPVLDHVGSYFVQGTFDPRDLCAVAAGCLCAAWSRHVLSRRVAATRGAP